MLTDDLIIRMTEFDKGDPKRIQHFVKVYEFAHVIGIKEGLDEKTQNILDIASILHDIGIRPAEEKYGKCDGKLQEIEGPAYARGLLSEFNGISKEITDRVCFLITHHHTYDQVDNIDYQILLEADFLVNALEDSLNKAAIISFRDKIFKTKTGIHILNTMFGL